MRGGTPRGRKVKETARHWLRCPFLKKAKLCLRSSLESAAIELNSDDSKCAAVHIAKLSMSDDDALGCLMYAQCARVICSRFNVNPKRFGPRAFMRLKVPCLKFLGTASRTMYIAKKRKEKMGDNIGIEPRNLQLTLDEQCSQPDQVSLASTPSQQAGMNQVIQGDRRSDKRDAEVHAAVDDDAIELETVVQLRALRGGQGLRGGFFQRFDRAQYDDDSAESRVHLAHVRDGYGRVRTNLTPPPFRLPGSPHGASREHADFIGDGVTYK